jgi:hypothetical protein
MIPIKTYVRALHKLQDHRNVQILEKKHNEEKTEYSFVISKFIENNVFKLQLNILYENYLLFAIISMADLVIIHHCSFNIILNKNTYDPKSSLTSVELSFEGTNKVNIPLNYTLADTLLLPFEKSEIEAISNNVDIAYKDLNFNKISDFNKINDFNQSTS